MSSKRTYQAKYRPSPHAGDVDVELDGTVRVPAVIADGPDVGRPLMVAIPAGALDRIVRRRDYFAAHPVTAAD